MSNWDALLRQSLIGLDALEARGAPIRWWSFGGGTALMVQLHHRDSKDVDLFILDPQYLGFLSPKMADTDIWNGPDYDESTHYLKLKYDEGEIDFIVAQSISDLPNGTFEFEGHKIPIEPPTEIILKKLFHRAAFLKPRDIFDAAVVLASDHADTLRENLHFVSDQRDALIKRMADMSDSYFHAAIAELDIFDEWRFIIPAARQVVTELVASIPSSTIKPPGY